MLPITAECVVPKLSIYSDILDFEDCYIGHPYGQTMTIVNESKLPAKYEVLPQDNTARALAEYTADQSTGTIPALGTHQYLVILPEPSVKFIR